MRLSYWTILIMSLFLCLRLTGQQRNSSERFGKAFLKGTLVYNLETESKLTFISPVKLDNTGEIYYKDTIINDSISYKNSGNVTRFFKITHETELNKILSELPEDSLIIFHGLYIHKLNLNYLVHNQFIKYISKDSNIVSLIIFDDCVIDTVQAIFPNTTDASIPFKLFFDSSCSVKKAVFLNANFSNIYFKNLNINLIANNSVFRNGINILQDTGIDSYLKFKNCAFKSSSKLFDGFNVNFFKCSFQNLIDSCSHCPEYVESEFQQSSIFYSKNININKCIFWRDVVFYFNIDSATKIVSPKFKDKAKLRIRGAETNSYWFPKNFLIDFSDADIVFDYPDSIVDEPDYLKQKLSYENIIEQAKSLPEASRDLVTEHMNFNIAHYQRIRNLRPDGNLLEFLTSSLSLIFVNNKYHGEFRFFSWVALIVISFSVLYVRNYSGHIHSYLVNESFSGSYHESYKTLSEKSIAFYRCLWFSFVVFINPQFPLKYFKFKSSLLKFIIMEWIIGTIFLIVFLYVFAVKYSIIKTILRVG